MGTARRGREGGREGGEGGGRENGSGGGGGGGGFAAVEVEVAWDSTTGPTARVSSPGKPVKTATCCVTCSLSACPRLNEYIRGEVYTPRVFVHSTIPFVPCLRAVPSTLIT